MSYFENYYNPEGEKTLRTYSRPVNLARFDRVEWMTALTTSDDSEISVHHFTGALITPRSRDGSPHGSPELVAGKSGPNSVFHRSSGVTRWRWLNILTKAQVHDPAE